jgi:Fic family protein
LQYVGKDERHRGEYKKLTNSVVAFDADGRELGVVFETASPFDTPQMMEELITWTRKNLDDTFYHPLIVIGIFIVHFLSIHPFQDGNGRLSRALTTMLLLKKGYAYVPYSSIESIIEQSKEGYYRALRRTQKTIWTETVDYVPWLSFLLTVLQKQKKILEEKSAQKTIEKVAKNHKRSDKKVTEKVTKMLTEKVTENQRMIIENIINNPRITSKELSIIVGISAQKVRINILKLKQKGILRREGPDKGGYWAVIENSQIKIGKI